MGQEVPARVGQPFRPADQALPVREQHSSQECQPPLPNWLRLLIPLLKTFISKMWFSATMGSGATFCSISTPQVGFLAINNPCVPRHSVCPPSPTSVPPLTPLDVRPPPRAPSARPSLPGSLFLHECLCHTPPPAPVALFRGSQCYSRFLLPSPQALSLLLFRPLYLEA